MDELYKMACKELGVETLETRNFDSYDFHELAVWQIKALVEKAYKMGQQAKST